MGKQGRRTPKTALVTRRDFMQKAGTAGIAAAAAPWLLKTPQAQAAQAGFAHGVASGDPLTDAVILWTRFTPSSAGAVLVNYLVATDPELSAVVTTGAVLTDAARDFTVKIDVGGLQPATTYYYQFKAAGLASPTGRTRTLPVGNVERLRYGVAVCASLAHGYFNAYSRLAARSDLDFVLHLGDYIYEYGNGEYGQARNYEPPHEIVSLADYRLRHAQYKREAELREMHRQHPVIAIWDDHEFANNCWKGGALGHPEYLTAQWDARVANALQAYWEWMPVRQPDVNNPRRNYRHFRFGNLADLYLLEERVGARDQQIPPPVNLAGTGFGAFRQTAEYENPDRQLLGATEERWLYAGLRASPTRWRLIGQGVMMAQLKAVGLANKTKLSQYFNNDQWDGYDPVRQRFFAMLEGDATHAPVLDVVVMTGDIHSSWGADLTPDPNNAFVSRGGYRALTGEGSLAVEFVSTSVTSPFPLALDVLTPVLRVENPHFKYVELAKRGYMLMDVTADRVVGEWWYVNTIAAPSSAESFGAAFQVKHGSSHLVRGKQTNPRANPPAPAP